MADRWIIVNEYTKLEHQESIDKILQKHLI